MSYIRVTYFFTHMLHRCEFTSLGLNIWTLESSTKHIVLAFELFTHIRSGQHKDQCSQGHGHVLWQWTQIWHRRLTRVHTSRVFRKRAIDVIRVTSFLSLWLWGWMLRIVQFKTGCFSWCITLASGILTASLWYVTTKGLMPLSSSHTVTAQSHFSRPSNHLTSRCVHGITCYRGRWQGHLAYRRALNGSSRRLSPGHCWCNCCCCFQAQFCWPPHQPASATVDGFPSHPPGVAPGRESSLQTPGGELQRWGSELWKS